MNDIKISIIVPVYNGEGYIRPLLNSIAAQKERNFELIIVDDGSKDNSVAIVYEYQNKIPNLKVLSQPNSGVSVARNNGISAAKGEYFCFCDADDVLSTDYLAVFSAIIDEYTPDVAVCGYKVFYGEKAPINSINEPPQATDLYKTHGLRAFKELSKSGLQTQIGNKLYKTSLVNLFNITFTPGNGYGEDMFFNWKCLLAAKSIIKIDCDLYFYRMIEGSASVKYHPHLYENYKEEYQQVLKFAKQIGFDSEAIQKDINQNLIERIPALIRMSVRRREGIRQAIADIRKIAEDKLMAEAISSVLNADSDINANILELALNMKKKRYIRLWFYGFKSEIRIALGRKLKNMRRIYK